MLVSQDQLQATHAKQSALTDKDSLTKFADFLRSEQATERTIKQYHSAINAFFKWCFDHKIKPWLAQYHDIKAYRNYLQDTVKAAKSTINLKLVAVRKFFQSLQDGNVRLDNPATGIKQKKDNTCLAERQKNITSEQLTAVMNEAGKSKNKDRNMAIIMLMGFAGLRCNEVCNIKLNEVNTHKKTVFIHRKRGKDQTIYLDDQRFEYLLPLIEKARKNQSEYLFCNESYNHSRGTNHLSPRGLIQIVDALLCRLELKEKRKASHCLRHTYARVYLINGGKKEDLQEMLGHTSIATTDIYAKQLRRESVLDSVMGSIIPKKS